MDLDNIERALTIRAVCAVQGTFELWNASNANKKEKENELFAMDVQKMTKLHLILVMFQFMRQRVEKNLTKHAKTRDVMLIVLRIFGLKQL